MLRNYREDQVLDIFREQAGALEERGVDLFILETFSDVEELADLPLMRSGLFRDCPVDRPGDLLGRRNHLLRQRPARGLGKLEGKEHPGGGEPIARSAPSCCLPILRELAGVLCRFRYPRCPMPDSRSAWATGRSIRSPLLNTLRSLPGRGRRTRCPHSLGAAAEPAPEHIHAMAEAVKKLHPAKSGGIKHAAQRHGDRQRRARGDRVAAREPESRSGGKNSSTRSSCCRSRLTRRRV